MLRSLLASAILSVTAQAWAGADCPKAPKDQWLSKHAMQKKIVNDYGFTIKLFKIDGHCYEIYGWSTYEGGEQEIEVYFNPVTGDIVKKKVKG